MRLTLASDQRTKLVEKLRRAGTNEIGGQMFGEQLAPSQFRVLDLTIQARHGSVARFLVDLLQAGRDAIRFFDRTKHHYTRFNYIGEWHSHPSFAVKPSRTDITTMRELVREAKFAGNFAVLVICRLDGDELTAAAWYFDPHGHEGNAILEVEY
jgi:hypothetical protein